MTKKYTNLIFQLCFEQTVVPFYDNVIVNKLSNRNITASHSPIDHSNIKEFFTVCDVPDYLDPKLLKIRDDIGQKKIPQYEGYSIDLGKFDGIDDLLIKTLSRNPRKNLRAKLRKLKANHQIRYEFFHGEGLDKKHYDEIFEVCYNLMESRFHQKKIYNRFLTNWKYYYNLFYPKVLAKKASICVIYDGTKPITITLNFHQTDIIFSFIQIYDIDYSRYSLGDIAMYKNLEWSFNNGINIWDVSKGVTGNKLRWCNHIYQFDYHLFYNRKSLISTFKVNYITIKLFLKQFLRDHGIIGRVIQLDRLYYYTKMKKLKNHNWKKR